MMQMLDSMANTPVSDVFSIGMPATTNSPGILEYAIVRKVPIA